MGHVGLFSRKKLTCQIIITAQSLSEVINCSFMLRENKDVSKVIGKLKS